MSKPAQIRFFAPVVNSPAQLIAFLEQQPDAGVRGGALFKTNDPRASRVSEMLPTFCRKRNIDLYMTTPSDWIYPDFQWWEATFLVVQSTRANK